MEFGTCICEFILRKEKRSINFEDSQLLGCTLIMWFYNKDLPDMKSNKIN